ncbi:MAG: histidine phosphatase family protein [Hamadaea sp.]|nr:histidine phosphatase family protein [Hamadaea sp.]
MAIRCLYLARHGDADAFGRLTDAGRRQMDLLGGRLAGLPVDAVWHSPLPRAVASAQVLARHLPGVPIAEAAELVDNIPYVPPPAETPPSWTGFFDGYDPREAAEGHAIAQSLLTRFAVAPAGGDRHEVLITHDYPIAWLVRHALAAPASRWLGLNSANTALTMVEYRAGLPPALVMFNDMSHLPAELRWTGFPPTARP